MINPPEMAARPMLYTPGMFQETSVEGSIKDSKSRDFSSQHTPMHDPQFKNSEGSAEQPGDYKSMPLRRPGKKGGYTKHVESLDLTNAQKDNKNPTVESSIFNRNSPGEGLVKGGHSFSKDEIVSAKFGDASTSEAQQRLIQYQSLTLSNGG